jgi:predicted transcriptional regulator
LCVLAGASVKKTATLLGVSRATVSKVMSAYTNHGKTTSTEKNSGKINTDRNRSSHMEKDCFENHRTIALQVIAELNIHLEDPVSTKTVRSVLHKSNIHGRAVITKPLITESNVQMRKRWCHDHKTWTSENWKCETDMDR